MEHVQSWRLPDKRPIVQAHNLPESHYLIIGSSLLSSSGLVRSSLALLFNSGGEGLDKG